MASPLIGVTSTFTPATDGLFGTISVGESYIQAVLRAGGLPLVIPVGLPREEQQAVFDRLDGVLLTGGSDINPERFAGLPHPASL